MSVNVKENGLLKNVEKKFRPKTFATFAAEHFKLGPSDKKLYLSDAVSAKISKVGESADWLKSKNKFDKGSVIFHKRFKQDGTIEETLYDNNWGICYVPIEGGKTYSISGQTGATGGASNVWFDSTKTNSLGEINNKSVVGSTTETAPANAKYIGLTVMTNEALTDYYELDIMQVEEGEPTPYQPYNKSNVELTKEIIEITDKKRVDITSFNIGSALDGYGNVFYEKLGKMVWLHIGMQGLTPSATNIVFYLPQEARPSVPIATAGYSSGLDNMCICGVGTNGIVNIYPKNSSFCIADITYFVD